MGLSGYNPPDPVRSGSIGRGRLVSLIGRLNNSIRVVVKYYVLGVHDDAGGGRVVPEVRGYTIPHCMMSLSGLQRG